MTMGWLFGTIWTIIWTSIQLFGLYYCLFDNYQHDGYIYLYRAVRYDAQCIRGAQRVARSNNRMRFGSLCVVIRHRVAITYVIWRIWMHCWARLLPGFRENRRWITSETRSTLACYRQMRTFLLIGLFTRSFDCSTSRYVKRLCAVIQRFGIVGWSTVISVFTNVYVAIITAKCSVPAQHLRTMRTQRPIKWNALAIANTIFSLYATWRLLQWPY